MATLTCAWRAPAAAEESYESVVVTGPDDDPDADAGRASSSVDRRDLDRRLPRSTPDALRYEPGVFVQQSAHGQGSAYLRGLTGQQTLLLFDGIRLNNSTYRQGPNQYFFTLDAHAVRSIAVTRGGASTRWGSDALGGVIAALPLEPSTPPTGTAVSPRLFARGATADRERGLRLQLDLTTVTAAGIGIGFVGGFGARRATLLHGPPVLNPDRSTDAGALPWVPRYKEYDPTLPFDRQPTLSTQLGTGFDELTGDGRLVLQLREGERLTVAGYAYREYDAPRTDQCPPPTASYDQCLTYEEQFRHLAYVAWDGRLGAIAESARATLSWQEQHENRRLDLPAANLVGHGVDTVETWGVTLHAATVPLAVADGVAATLSYGADTYFDWVRSQARHAYTDTGDAVAESRGQYLDGATYTYGGLFTDLSLAPGDRVEIDGGARLGYAVAHARGDPASGTAPVDRRFTALVGHAGVSFAAAPPLTLLANYDYSFRAPNLDDMTARQQTGPGFQFENPRLHPERAHTFEAGGRLKTVALVADLWLFETLLVDAITKVAMSATDCPPSTPQCTGSWSRFQLQNSPSYSELRGVEAAARLRLPYRVSLRATVAYVWSEGPRQGSVAEGVYGVALGDRVPLSRTPPLHGTAEFAWTHASGVSAGGGLQWAAAQRRLAIADYTDGRIPKYGTPGFAVVHLRGAYRLDTDLVVAIVVENLLNASYRFHGSSVNGAGRGLIVHLEAGHWL
ncbi:MAG: TonB-dependent receptor [Deltaproteobacteria bacterium]|nr:TonB-dependent receptor [Deltaproteobacteria bacterium]